MTEEKLSDKIEEMREEDIEEYDLTERESKILYVEDVKDFIKKLKEEFSYMEEFARINSIQMELLNKLVDKLVGKELT